MSKIFPTVIVLLFATAAFAGDGTIRPSPRPLPETYMVRLDDALTPEAVRLLATAFEKQHSGRLRFVWDTFVPGFSIEASEAAARAISRNPHVSYVEEVGVGEIAQSFSTTHWNLDRIDQRVLPLSGTASRNCETEGVVNVYVVDTGIRATHQAFISSTGGSRVIAGYNARPNESQDRALNPCPGISGTAPCGQPSSGMPKYCLAGGHGTAVASIIAGRVYGAFTKANVISVRTHDCVGGSSATDIVKNAMNWINQDIPTRINAAGQQMPAVVNMSFGFDVNSVGITDLGMMEEAITRLIDDRHVTVVAAAHNMNYDATNISPARLARGNGGKVITVGASTTTDRRWVCNPANSWENPAENGSATTCGPAAAGSNFGQAVDIFAPGQNIRAAGIKGTYMYLGFETCCDDSDTAERQFLRSGTSFAAPLVAAIAARHLYQFPTETADQIWQRILSQSTGDGGSWTPVMPATTDSNSGPLYGSPNRLLFKAGTTYCNISTNP